MTKAQLQQRTEADLQTAVKHAVNDLIMRSDLPASACHKFVNNVLIALACGSYTALERKQPAEAAGLFARIMTTISDWQQGK